jgi:YegS/Rv2252/BmrU family lipid kinase
MRKAALLYNPDSGGRKQRQRDLESALAVLRNGGVEADLRLTQSTDHAGEETRRAVAAGCDTIFACGGDGTVHNIAQVLAGSSTALAILPMGTANALAHDIGLPRNVIAAAESALRATPRRIALGHIQYKDLRGNPGTRYFVLAAGVGVDAHLFYKLRTGVKQRLGMAAYYAKAWNLWFTYAMARFSVQYVAIGGTTANCLEATELMAIRIRNFGGVVQELAPGASLDRDDVRLVFAQTASRLAYLAYVTRGLLRLRWSVPGIGLAYSKKVKCDYISADAQPQTKIYIEADGELLGTLPGEITVVPNALILMTPPRST